MVHGHHQTGKNFKDLPHTLLVKNKKKWALSNQIRINVKYIDMKFMKDNLQHQHFKYINPLTQDSLLYVYPIEILSQYTKT